MNPEIVRALTGPRDHPVLTFVRTYRAGVADLREACTDVERLARWFGTVTGDPVRVGDAFEAHLSDDPTDVATGRVLRCEDDEVAVSWAWQGEVESEISAQFERIDDERAELTLRHSLAEPGHAVGYGGGWEQVLESLGRALGAATPDAADDAIGSAAVERWRTITRAPLEVERVVAAGADTVWAAVATADGLASWWWRHWSDVTVAADVRVGGGYRIEAPGAGIVLDGTYLAVEPPTDVTPGRIEMTWRWADDDGTSSDEAVEIRFVPEGDATRVRVRHSGPWADDAPAASYRQGWDVTLGALADTVGARGA